LCGKTLQLSDLCLQLTPYSYNRLATHVIEPKNILKRTLKNEERLNVSVVGS